MFIFLFSYICRRLTMSCLGSPIQPSIEDIDFEFKNAIVKIIIDRGLPEIKIMGKRVGPLEEGMEVEVEQWVALELVRAGFAHFHRSETIDLASLRKIQWKETIQPGRQLSSIPESFYPKMRRYISELRGKSARDPSYVNKFNKALRLAQDIVNCRLRKIVGLAASPGQVSIALQSLSREERVLYDSLHTIISEWRSKILKAGFSSDQ